MGRGSTTHFVVVLVQQVFWARSSHGSVDYSLGPWKRGKAWAVDRRWGLGALSAWANRGPGASAFRD
jgi:hypothetical protein